MQKNNAWKIPASHAFRGPEKGSKGPDALPGKMISSSKKKRKPATIQVMVPGMGVCLAIMIPPATGMSTRMKGVFRNALSNIVL